MIKKVIVINKDTSFIKGLKYSFEHEGFIVESALTIKEATEKMKKYDYDLVIMDILLPDGNGLLLLKAIRGNSQVPIIVLSDKNEEMTEILALEYGADDYLTKSINFMVLKAKIKALFRRINMNNTGKDKHVVKIDDFIINTVGRRISINGRNVVLTGKEFDLFYLLISNPGRVFTREELLETIWGYEYFGDIRTVDVHIRRLREKIEEDSRNVEYIHTKWGKGYYFKRKNAGVALE